MSIQLKIELVKDDAQRKRFALLALIAVAAMLWLGAWPSGPSVKATQRTSAPWRTGLGTQSSLMALKAATGLSNQTSEGITTTLSPSGFSPTELTHAAGRFNLRVNNQSGLPKVMLRLSKSNGEKLTEVSLTNQARWVTAAVELAPGSYTLTVANHSDWTCQITIQ